MQDSMCTIYMKSEWKWFESGNLRRTHHVDLKWMRWNGLPWSEEKWHCYSRKGPRWRSTHGYEWQMTEQFEMLLHTTVTMLLQPHSMMSPRDVWVDHSTNKWCHRNVFSCNTGETEAKHVLLLCADINEHSYGGHCGSWTGFSRRCACLGRG